MTPLISFRGVFPFTHLAKPHITMNIVVSPAKTRGRYEARLEGRLIATSETPFYAGARILKAEGVPPGTILTMTHEGSETVCMTSTVGDAAALSLVDDPDRGFSLRPFRPSPFGRPR